MAPSRAYWTARYFHVVTRNRANANRCSAFHHKELFHSGAAPKMKLPLWILSSLCLWTYTTGITEARPHRNPPTEVASTNCYDSADHSEIRLWDARAPGAIGDDPCRDIPYLRVFPAISHDPGPQPTILIIPGGGYDRLTDTKEQVPVAEYFSRELHVTAVLLYYRLVQHDGTYRYPVPMWDGQRALKLLRYRASQLNIDPHRVAVFGFSAGGHLASTLALHSATDFDLPQHDPVDSQPGRPDLLGLGYPVISMDPADVPHRAHTAICCAESKAPNCTTCRTTSPARKA